MRYIRPAFYDKFKCVADKCPDTCCTGWQIMIDDDTLEKYKNLEGSMGERLSHSLDWEEGCFLQKSGRCSMLNDNNLCDLVTEQGEEYLCVTCDRYPRHTEEFDGLREYSLSLSCPIAAEIILAQQEPVSFITEETDEDDPLEEDFEDFDFLLFTQLEDARAVLFQIIQNRKLPMEQRMDRSLEMAVQMQKCVEEDRLFDMDDVIRSFAEQSDPAQVNGSQVDVTQLNVAHPGTPLSDEERFNRMREDFTYFYRLERLRPEWGDVLQETWDNLYDKGYDHYREIRRSFLKECEKDSKWSVFLENLMMFFVYTYFCGAVYDDWIYSKVAFSVFSTRYIQEFVMCSFYLTDKKINWQHATELAYRYAREIEHSDENLDSLEEWLQQKGV